MNNYLEPGKGIKALIFDLDGTLADTMPLHMEAWTATAEFWGVGITPKMVNDRLGIPTFQVIQELNNLYGWSIDPGAFRHKKNEIYQQLKQRDGKINPIKEVCHIAFKYHRVFPMSVGTGSIRSNAESALSDIELIDHFVTVVTAEDVAKHKPHPETFLRCAEAMNISPSECLVYEDSPLGTQAALAGGMHAVNIISKEIFHP